MTRDDIAVLCLPLSHQTASTKCLSAKWFSTESLHLCVNKRKSEKVKLFIILFQEPVWSKKFSFMGSTSRLQFQALLSKTFWPTDIWSTQSDVIMANCELSF
jgi:hypothetical protein